jgi:hypothetical protein
MYYALLLAALYLRALHRLADWLKNNSVSDDHYWLDGLQYLIEPSQISMTQKFDIPLTAAHLMHRPPYP